MLNSSKLIIFAAPSGAGKSSLIKKIIEISKEKIELSVSATTTTIPERVIQESKCLRIR